MRGLGKLGFRHCEPAAAARCAATKQEAVRNPLNLVDCFAGYASSQRRCRGLNTDSNAYRFFRQRSGASQAARLFRRRTGVKLRWARSCVSQKASE